MNPLRLGVFVACVSCLVLPGMRAAAAESRTPFSIPEGLPLERALTLFSVQSDRDILFTPDLVARRRGRGVSGVMPPAEALAVLLQGSGLTWRLFQGRYLIEPAQAPQIEVGEEPAVAAEVDGVVVTALRRPTLDRLTPMSMRVLSGDDLRRTGTATFAEAADLMPGLTQANTGTGRHRLSLRGVYGSGEATTALYYNDVPVTGPSGTTADPGGSAPELLLVDVERLELLRGPQGTLYGASAMGGALKVVFNRPDLAAAGATLSAEVSTNADQWGEALSVVLNQPLVRDRVGLRLAAYRRRDPAYIDNARLGQRKVNESLTAGARLGLGIDITDDLSLNLAAAYQEAEETDSSSGWAEAPPNVSRSAVRTPFDSHFTLYEGTLAWRMSDVSLTAKAAAYSWDSTRRIDYTGTLESERLSPSGCLRYLQLDAQAQCSPAQLAAYAAYVDSRAPGLLNQPIQLDAQVQELRLQSETDGFVAWTAGLFHEVRDDVIDSQVLAADPATGLPRAQAGFTGRRIVDSRLTQRALYGEVTLGADRVTSLVLGLRRFEYERRTDGQALVVNVISNTQDANFHHVTSESGWSSKVLASHRFSPTLMGYVQASQGFRPGGVNPAPGLPDNLAAYGADSLWNYEVGFKGSWLENRLTLNAAAYRIDWRDMQYTANSANGAFSYIANLGRARVNGLEADAGFTITPETRGGLNLALTDAILTRSQTSAEGAGLGSAGNRIPAVARVSAGGWLERRVALASGWEVLLRGGVTYTGRSHSTFQPGVGVDQPLGDTWRLDLRATLRADDWRLSAYVDNATDADGPEFATTGLHPTVFAPRPRRFGVTASYAF